MEDSGDLGASRQVADLFPVNFMIKINKPTEIQIMRWIFSASNRVTSGHGYGVRNLSEILAHGITDGF